MKTLLIFSLMALVMIQCSIECEEFELKASDSTCSTRATARDLTGLDGCGFVFELEDGTRLEPVIIGWCGTPPVPEEQMADPLNDFEWVDGKKVMIDYEPFDAVSICMVGQSVKITCISEVASTETDI